MTEPFVPFALPDLGEAEFEAVKSVLSSGWITSGERVRQFEARFAEAVGARHAVAVNSCTAAMHLALEASGLQAGDEVITTPYTFAATAEVIRYFDARPVLVDVDPATLNIRPDLVSEAVTARTRAILPVHIAGLPVDLSALGITAADHGLTVIEDAAHAFPAEYQGRSIGSISDFTCFSFYATKTITTAEGGMITTDDERHANRCRTMALHGISKDAWKRYTAEGSWYYEVVAPGFKYNMTDIAAALGLVQLQKASEMADKRRAIAEQYKVGLGDDEAFQLPADPSDCRHAWHLYMLRLNLDRLLVDRSQFVAELKKKGIGASVHFIPLHIHPYYRDTYGYSPHDFPVAYAEYLREISLPIYSAMKRAEVTRVIDAVRQLADENRR